MEVWGLGFGLGLWGFSLEVSGKGVGHSLLRGFWDCVSSFHSGFRVSFRVLGFRV